MPKLMGNLYDNLDEAKAFAISFTNFAYIYGDMCFDDFCMEVCEACGKEVQHADYRMPRSTFKKDTAILASYEPGVSPSLRDEIIEKFDATEEDFRPVRTKKGEIVYYQVAPKHELLPLAEVNEWPVMSTCPACGSVMHEQPRRGNDQDEPYYYITEEALNEMHDLNVTREHFMRYSVLFVISRRLYDFLIERYPRTHYFPFFLREE